MDMEERKGMAEGIPFGDLPDMDDVLCILDQVLLSEDCSFRLTRRPGGVDKKGRVMGACLCIQWLEKNILEIIFPQ